jgi:hypothetical protein
VSPVLHAVGYDGDRLQAFVTPILAANTLCSMSTRSHVGHRTHQRRPFCSNSDLFGTGLLAEGHYARADHELYAARFPRYADALRREPSGEHTTFGYRELRFFHFIPERVHILDEWEFGDEVFITATVVY